MLRPFRRRLLLTLFTILILSSSLWGCNRLLDRLSDALYPSATPGMLPAETPEAATPETSATIASTQTGPTQTPASLPTPPIPPTTRPTATPVGDVDLALVYARNASLYRGDYVGAAAVEAAIVPQLESWVFSQGLLAMVQGRAIDVVDLNVGQTHNWQVDTPSDVEYAELLWGSGRQALLHVAWLAEAGEGTGRAVELHALSANDGAGLGVVRLEVAGGLRVLRYDDAAQRVSLILYNADGSFEAVSSYDVTQGVRSASFPVSGTGNASLSPDGSRLLVQQPTEAGNALSLYDLVTGAELHRWDLPQQHTVDHLWAPDGRRVAYLLRSGDNAADPQAQGLGVWVLDTASLQTTRILDEPSLAASLLGWSPDGVDIAGYHRDDSGAAYTYIIGADGSNRRLLNLPDDARVIGWMPSPGRADIPRVVLDPWRARFVDARGDSHATADLVAEIVALQSEVDDQAMLSQITNYLREAGWALDYGGPSLKRLDADVFVVQLPPADVYLIQPQRAQLVANGQLILDARLVGDDLGLVHGVLWDGQVQPTYQLMRRNVEGLWQVVWQPLGQRDWIATDGEIAMAGEGLDRLEVSGRSFGLDVEGNPFSECRRCPQRQFVATWERQGDGYVRRTQLPADATLDDILWEMTSPTPYSVLYESVRRLRQGEPLDILVAGAGLVSQLREAGLGAPDVRLLAEQESAESVVVVVPEPQRRYRVTVQGGRITAFEAAP